MSSSHRSRLRAIAFGAALATLQLSSADLVKAQSSQTTLESLLLEIAAASPRLEAARWRVAAARSDRRAAGRPQDPMVEIEADNLGLTSEDERMMVRYALEQPIPTIGMLPLQRKIADALVQQTESAGESVRLDAMLAGARAFVMLRMTDGEIAINERQQRLVELITESALARMRSGMDAHHDVLQSQAELLSLQNQQLVLEARRTEAQAMINALRNQPSPTPFQAGESWAPLERALDPATLERAAVERRPELRQMAAMQREQRAMSELMHREGRPMFRAGAFRERI